MMHTFLSSLDGKLDDIVKVNTVGAVAFIVSWSDFDHWFRTLGLIAALIYTIIKIIQSVKEMQK